MNREIKFRGKEYFSGKWIVGNLIVTEKACYIYDKLSIPYEQCPSEWFIRVIPETVGQYTGKVDANCKEIYEGDKDESGNFIQYVDEYACFCYLDKDMNVSFQCVPTFFEPIGTIHD